MRALGPVLVLLLATSTSVALAQDAEALVEEGIALRVEGRDAEALTRFEQAYAASESPRALAQIALAEQALGRFVAAEQHLQGALALADDRFIRRNRALLEQALEEIRTQVGELTLTGGTPGATLTIDGADRGPLPLPGPLRLDPGTHHVEAHADGHHPFAADVEIAPGARAELAVVLEALPPVEVEGSVEDVAPALPAADGPGWLLPTGAAAAGVGAIGMGIGIGLALVREDHAQARLTCSDVDPACRDRYQAALDAETGAIVSFVIGGALAAGGATLLVLSMLADEPTDQVAACAPGVLAIACAARF